MSETAAASVPENQVAPPLNGSSEAPQTETKEAPSTEAKPAEPSVEAKEGHRLARIARIERKAREERKAASEQMKLLEAQRKKIEAFDLAERELKVNPVAFLEKHFGIDWNYITDKQFETMGRRDPVKSLEEKLERIERERIEERTKRDDDAKRSQAEADARYFRDQITKTLSGDEDRFELCLKAGDDAVEAIHDVIVGRYRKTGKRMTYEDAAALVEEQLLEQARAFTASKKLAPKTEPKDEPQRDGEAGGVGRTLTNGRTAPNAAPLSDRSMLSEEESLRHAATLLKWK